jgi:inorganic phosphate transporter, PiT family
VAAAHALEGLPEAEPMTFLLFAAAYFLAYSNGANDNFKGVASLFGSATCGYRTAIAWATATTFSGSVCAIFLAPSLLTTFSGHGLAPERIVTSEYFLLAMALGAGATVIAATLLGFPISTTHALLGAIIGSGLMAAGRDVEIRAVGRAFVLPLLLSPPLAVIIAALLYVLLLSMRLRLGITKEWCICVGEARQLIPIPQPTSALALQPVGPPALEISTGEQLQCSERYAGRFFGVQTQQFIDALHVVSAGVVSFARGLNDTPKIAAILIAMKALDVRVGMIAIAVAIAIGGLLNARKVAQTMSLRITPMDHDQGLAANLATGALVILASTYGLPVSTTHVSVGALFGIGVIRRQANARVVRDILFSWILTLPCAAIASGLIWWLLVAI